MNPIQQDFFGSANHAHALDSAMTFLFHIYGHWRRASHMIVSRQRIFRDMNFSREIYDDAKKWFPDGTGETLVSRPSGAPSGTFDPAVRLVHTPTGIEIVRSDYPTPDRKLHRRSYSIEDCL